MQCVDVDVKIRKKATISLPFKNNYNNCLTRTDGILTAKVQGLSMNRVKINEKNSSVDQMLRFILML